MSSAKYLFKNHFSPINHGSELQTDKQTYLTSQIAAETKNSSLSTLQPKLLSESHTAFVKGVLEIYERIFGCNNLRHCYHMWAGVMSASHPAIKKKTKASWKAFSKHS